MDKKVGGGGVHGIRIAHIGRIDAYRVGVGQGGGEVTQGGLTPAHQPEHGALRRVGACERLANAARCAGKEDFQGSHRINIVNTEGWNGPGHAKRPGTRLAHRAVWGHAARIRASSRARR
ncbi:hypothetical protein D3C72_792660 [compost metagenome]